MKCDICKKEMEEKTLFTSVEYTCNYCKDDGWQSIEEMLDLLSPMDLPLKLKFKDEDGKAYDIKGRIFREPSGCCYTNKNSRVYITFPYSPKSEYIDVAE